MKKIKYIELVFENCEVCRLTPDMFEYFYIRGIKENLFINYCQYKDGEYEINKNCDYFQIYINTLGLNNIIDEGFKKNTLRKRIKQYKDITSLYVTYEDNTEIQYYVPWNEENDYLNKYQRNYYDDCYCVITIERNNNG